MEGRSRTGWGVSTSPGEGRRRREGSGSGHLGGTATGLAEGWLLLLGRDAGAWRSARGRRLLVPLPVLLGWGQRVWRKCGALSWAGYGGGDWLPDVLWLR